MKCLDLLLKNGWKFDRYKPNKPIRFKTSMLRSDLFDFSDAYTVIKGDITLTKAVIRDFIDVRNRFFSI